MRKPSALIERLEGMAIGEMLAGNGVTVRRTKDRWWYVEYGSSRANLITAASVVVQLWGPQLAAAIGLSVPAQMTLW